VQDCLVARQYYQFMTEKLNDTAAIIEVCGLVGSLIWNFSNSSCGYIFVKLHRCIFL